MAAFDFPSNPSDGDTYTANDVTFVYESANGAWRKNPASATQGDKGQKGQKGTDGNDGSGTKGNKGQKGDDGADGTSVKGQKGESVKGDKGQKGVDGDDGTSVKGNKGQKGDDNSTKGQKGESVKGDKGQKGDSGSGGGSATTINNNVDNYLITGTGTANTLQGESNLTFDGSTLNVIGSGVPTIESASSLDVTATSTKFSGSASFAGGHPTSRFYSGADDLVVANFTQDTGISIMCGSSNDATVAFGSTTFGTGAIAARLYYDESNNKFIMQTQTNGYDIELKSAGTITLGDLNNPTIIIEDMTATGNFGVEVDGTIYPKSPGVHGYRDLGLTGIRWNNIYGNYLHGDGSNITNITGGVPTGTIVMYNGDVAPSGWALCDGQGGRPDLRDKFIVGAGSAYSRGATGGANSVTLSINEMPAHDHDTDLDGYKVFATGPNAMGFIGYGGPGGYPGGYVNMQNTGGGQAHENRPPYYALTYIIKT